MYWHVKPENFKFELNKFLEIFEKARCVLDKVDILY